MKEPWIPVRVRKKVQEVSLSEALLRAHEFERIEVTSPLEEVALHRLLLAVLHRALRGPRNEDEALDLCERGEFAKRPIQDYLDRYRDRFFLFHDAAPFLQIADLPEEDPKPWTYLLPERSSGNNPTLFDHTMDDRPPLASYAEAARALITHQTFNTGGLLKRLGVTSTKAAPLAKAAVFLPTGRNLFKTLVLNLVPYDPIGDAAIWEVPPLQTDDVKGYCTEWPLSGVARIYTWPTMGVRLLDEGGGVRFIRYGPGVKPHEASFPDPMVAYTLSKEGRRAVRLNIDKSFWRDFNALLPEEGREKHPPRVLKYAREVLWELERATLVPLRVMGQVTTQAKVLDIRREVYPFPRDAFDPKGAIWIRNALERAEEVGQVLVQMGRCLAHNLLGAGDARTLNEFQESLPLMRLYWNELDRAFLAFLERLVQDNGNAAFTWWKGEVEGAARRAWKVTRESIGTGVRQLKAVQRAEAKFGQVVKVVRA